MYVVSFLAVAVQVAVPPAYDGNDDGRTYLWNAVSRRLTATLSVPGAQGPPGDAPNVLFSPANDTLATSSFYGRVYLWNIMARKLTATFTVPDGAPILGLAFNPNGRTLAINDDRTTYLWKLK